MVEDIIKDAEQRMSKSVSALETAFNRIRTGRAHPSILDGVLVPYYGTETPLNQLASVTVEEGRQLLVQPYDKSAASAIEKAIMKDDLGLNPANQGDVIRVPMPPLTEETRREYTKQARNEAEQARVAIRNIRRDANSDLKELLKAKEISEDEERRAEERIQKLTDRFIGEVDSHYNKKEEDLLSV